MGLWWIPITPKPDCRLPLARHEIGRLWPGSYHRAINDRDEDNITRKARKYSALKKLRRDNFYWVVFIRTPLLTQIDIVYIHLEF
jgi:hypothetical protein